MQSTKMNVESFPVFPQMRGFFVRKANDVGMPTLIT